MPWAIFHRKFNHDFRPERAACIEIQPLDVPQEFPGKVIDAAVTARRGDARGQPAAGTETRLQAARQAGGITPILT